jgi:ABC-type multidrug transport system fused ATPase/permease subunit
MKNIRYGRLGAMDALMTYGTSFVIAHSLSTVRDAYPILVMRDGCVATFRATDLLLEA